MEFVAIDVETANSDYSSLCQIGIAEFKNGEVVNYWSTLINPEEYFDFFNVELHGIDEETVKNAPTFSEIYDELSTRLLGRITVHHMPFDKIAITRACEKYNLEPLMPDWLDSARIARRAWHQFARKGYGLSNLARFLNIDFKHHDALEDAIVAGIVVVEAISISGYSIEEWLENVGEASKTYKRGLATICLDGNPEGLFFGEQVVFTGTLSLNRIEAGKLAAELGCNVTNSVTKKTTMLIVGNQDSYRLAGFEKSSKHRKAEELVKKGIELKILSEADFREIVEMGK